jgi:hypothetical protein
MDEAMKLGNVYRLRSYLRYTGYKKVQTIISDPYPGMIYKDPIVIL